MTKQGPLPIRALGRDVIIGLWIDLGSNLLALAGKLVDLRLLNQMRDPEILDPISEIPNFDAQANFSEITSFGPLVTLVLVGPVILRWIYRASRNAHAFARGLSISPGWAVGWYFIPFASLWKPYEAMSQIWRATMRPDNWRLASTSPLLAWWWGLWLSSNLVGTIGGRMLQPGAALEFLITADWLVAGSLAVACIVNPILMGVVHAVSTRQDRNIAEGLGAQPAPVEPAATPA